MADGISSLYPKPPEGLSLRKRYWGQIEKMSTLIANNGARIYHSQ
jgi:hypothetical protein